MNSKIKFTIKYKIITGKDIINLFNTLIESLSEYDLITGPQSNNSIYRKFAIPNYSIKISESSELNSSNIEELNNFIANQKQPIHSIEMRLYIDTNITVSLLIDNTKKYRTNSYYMIEGPEKWVSIINSKFEKIINNMNDIPRYAKFIANNEFAFIFGVIIILDLQLMYLFREYIQKLDDIQSIATNVFSMLILLSIFSKYLDNLIYTIEIKLNEDYLDPAMRNRATFASLFGILSFLLTILSFITS